MMHSRDSIRGGRKESHTHMGQLAADDRESH